MICSTSTLSERTEKSAIACLFQGLPAIPAAGLARTPREELRCLRDAGAQDAERADEGLTARQVELGGVFTNLRETVGVRRQRLPVAEQPAPGAREDAAHHALRVEGVPETVVIEDARNVRPRREHRFQRPLDRLLHRPPIDLVLHARCERHLFERADEVPVLPARLRVADDLDAARVTAPESRLRGPPV